MCTSSQSSIELQTGCAKLETKVKMHEVNRRTVAVADLQCWCDNLLMLCIVMADRRPNRRGQQCFWKLMIC